MYARILLGAFLGVLASSAAVVGGACNDSVPSDQQTTTTTASGTGGAASDGGYDAGCYPHPTTYLEIINACTDAQAVAVSPVLPLLQPDGGLPPLP